MSRLDDELAQAVEEIEAEPVEAPARHTEQARPRRSVGLLIALLVMAGGILALVMTSFEDSAIYAKKVDELVADKDRLASRSVNVTGTLVKGSLRRRDDPCEYRFKIENNGVQLAVHYPQCVVPDTFKDVPDMDVDVTATGTLSKSGHFEANHIMAKCPSKYEMEQRAKAGDAIPHGQITPAAMAPEPNR